MSRSASRRKLFLVVGLPLVLAGLVPAAAAGQSEALTNDDILNLTEAGLPAAAIVAKVRSADTAFDTSPKRLAALAQAGVHADVLAALMPDDEARTSQGLWRLWTTPGVDEERLELVVTDNDDLRQLLLPGASVLDIRYFQVILGVPRDLRYRDPKFDIVRGAFTTSCSGAAEGFLETGRGLLRQQVPQIPTTLHSYEEECLKPLAEVPRAIRNVGGVLTFFGKPQCSATIISANKILTARHCFSASHSPTGESAWGLVAKRLVGFSSFELHSGREEFTVGRIIGGEKEPISPYEDTLVVEIIGRPLEHFARLATKELSQQETPILTWLVGSNGLLGDLDQVKDSLEYVRAAAPGMCAVLETTEAGCLYHTCQAGHTTSGAGLLVESNSGVTLLGVHRGTIVTGAECERNPPLDLRMNLGAVHTSEPLVQEIR